MLKWPLDGRDPSPGAPGAGGLGAVNGASSILELILPLLRPTHQSPIALGEKQETRQPSQADAEQGPGRCMARRGKGLSG